MKERLGRIEPILFLLFIGTWISVGCLFWVDKYDTDRMFQVISGLVIAFSSSFFTRLKSGGGLPEPPAHGAQATDTRTTTISTEGSEEPPR